MKRDRLRACGEGGTTLVLADEEGAWQDARKDSWLRKVRKMMSGQIVYVQRSQLWDVIELGNVNDEFGEWKEMIGRMVGGWKQTYRFLATFVILWLTAFYW